MAERTVKLCSIRDLVFQIPDGARVAVGGFAVYQKPMAIIREIIRQRKHDLVLVGAVHSMDADMLIGAGCVNRIETSYVGMEKYGLAQNFRRAVQNGTVKVVHYPEMLSCDRFRADREGWPFWPSYSLGGCKCVLENPDIVEYCCPVTGRRAWALPAAKPDVVLLHGYQGDCYGNIQLQSHGMLPQALDVDMARSSMNVLATVETLVDNNEICKQPQLTAVPAFRTKAVVALAHGSHPLSTLMKCREDEAHMKLYVEAAKTTEAFASYLEEYVYGVKDETEYQQKIGRNNLAGLEEA
ncbi:MAG: CoA-transferase [Clostridia bacterium]